MGRWIKMAMIYITARAVFPASEHKTEEWLKENSGLSELYGVEPGRVSRHHLYKVSRKLYQAKEEIDRWMARRTGELFTPQDKIILYDLTNLYFEGRRGIVRRRGLVGAKRGVMMQSLWHWDW
ncbi:hypothetical protein [Thermospira aquatica]|uniref:Transposase n=1 Tax=Thermospira aquatica TaxID=2828656 RepID=A0AAX3BF21_9SPIR|nr:hypothetical protein [Thermospira aquatica]URA10733.1 hypothetical protein KDW03_02720 [Thermospira aquatica]